MRSTHIALREEAQGDEGCFDDEQAVTYVEGRLSAAARARVEEHAGGCAECRVVLSELVRAGGGATEPKVPARGTRVGRYVVLSPQGAGAMGVVYAAFDPELERKVALKLLSPSVRDQGEEWAQRLRREAQAMARVSHENVVPVFDVGTWAGRVFVAMELIDGVSFSRWCREAPRARAAVLARLVEAGRGLAAAHAAGVVHRDFKPDNVLVSATRGARVTDFGLSSIEQGPVDGLEGQPMLESATWTRGLVGTPAYMAPEQLRGERADARSDQFAYCVMAYEALHGVRPFHGARVNDLLLAVAAGLPASGRRDGVSRRVRQALARGLSAEPERRFESMGALLEAMGPPRPRGPFWGAIGVGLGGAFGLASLVMGPARGGPAPCANVESHLSGVWDETRRAAVRGALDGLGPVGRGAWLQVEASFDRRAREWAAARGEACRATYVRHEQSESVLALRYGCLDRRRAELDALGTELVRADAAAALKAAAAAEALSHPGECADVAALLGPVPLPSEPARAREAQDVGHTIEASKATCALGRFREAADLARAALARARALGHRPLEAEALYRLAVAAINDDAWDVAETSGVEAYWLAEAGRDDVIKVRTAALLASLISRTSARRQEGLRWSDLGFAALARVGVNDELEALLLGNRGIVLSSDLARRDEAAELLGRALEVGARADMPAPSRARLLSQLGLVRYGQRRIDEARPLFEQACELTARAMGPDHPDVGICQDGMGATSAESGDLGRARAHFERAFDLLSRALGAEHPWALNAQNNLCLTLWASRAQAPALVCQLEAHRRALEKLAPGHEVAIDAALQLALFLADEQPREAPRLLDAALVKSDVSEWQRALALAVRGRARLAQGDHGGAIVELRRALPLLENDMGGTHLLVETEFALARALAQRSPAEARALASRARAQLRAVETMTTPLAHEIDRWLVRRP